MRKLVLTAFAAVLAILLFGCGGGSGGSGDASAPPAAIATATCPNGNPVPTTGTKDCSATGITALPSSSDLDPVAISIKGYAVESNGQLDPTSVTAQTVKLWLGAADTGTQIAGSPVLSSDGKTITFTAVQRLASGKKYTLAGDVKDTVGRTVGFASAFTTAAMVCNAITGVSLAAQTTWSNPANYSSVLGDCDAPIGVQAMLNPAYNKMDVSCVIPSIGQPLSDACKAQLANGTIVLADTSIVINSHLVTWALANGSDGLGKLMALDTNDPTNANPLVVASAGFTSALKWVIGNPTGVSVCTADGNASQVTVDSVTNNLIATRVRGC